MSDEASVLAAFSDALFVAGIDCTLPQSVIDAVTPEIRWAIAEAVVGAFEAYGNNDQEPPCARGVDCDWCVCPFHKALKEWRAKLPARNAEGGVDETTADQGD